MKYTIMCHETADFDGMHQYTEIEVSPPCTMRDAVHDWLSLIDPEEVYAKTGVPPVYQGWDIEVWPCGAYEVESYVGDPEYLVVDRDDGYGGESIRWLGTDEELG